MGRARGEVGATATRHARSWGFRHNRSLRDVAIKRYIEEEATTYWSQVRRPFPCLMFVLPWLALYEGGVWALGDPGVRTGADAWMRELLSRMGLTDRWLPPLALVLALLVWQALDARKWRFRSAYLLGMLIESLVLAVALIGLNKVLDLAFVRLESARGPVVAATGASGPPGAALLGFIGAGVYEEALFRLALIPLIYQASRILQAPGALAETLAITGSSLLFSIAHHLGLPGEPFAWYAFVFRWLAGVAFAAIFLTRGFGVAVGTHAVYDVLVGSLGWRL